MTEKTKDWGKFKAEHEAKAEEEALQDAATDKELAAEEELAALRPELDGKQVMEHLGLTPGPEIGKALAFLMEIRLEEGLIGEEALLRRLDEWYALQR